MADGRLREAQDPVRDAAMQHQFAGEMKNGTARNENAFIPEIIACIAVAIGKPSTR